MKTKFTLLCSQHGYYFCYEGEVIEFTADYFSLLDDWFGIFGWGHGEKRLLKSGRTRYEIDLVG